MKTFCFYEESTGLFSRKKLTCTSEKVAARSCPAGHVPMEGDFDPLSERVENGRVVEYIPDSPGEDYEWIAYDSEGNRVRRWLKKPEVVERENSALLARAKIDELERSQLRSMRESVVGNGTPEGDAAAQRLAAIDAQIVEQRAIINASTLRDNPAP